MESKLQRFSAEVHPMKTMIAMLVFCVALAAPLAAARGNCQGRGQGQGKGKGQQCSGQCDRKQCQNCAKAESCPRAQVRK